MNIWSNAFKTFTGRDDYDYFFGLPTDRTQYYIQSFLSGASRTMAGLYSARDNTAYMDDYLSNRGISYGDVKYPSRTVGWLGGYGAGSAVRSVSDNVTGLYHFNDKEYVPSRRKTHDVMYG